LDEPVFPPSLSPDSPEYLGRHLEALRRFAADHPVEAGLIINALVGGMVQSNAHSFMRGLASEPPRPARPEEPRPLEERVVERTPEPSRAFERTPERIFDRVPERMTGPHDVQPQRSMPRSTPPRASVAPFSAQLMAASEAPMPAHHAVSPPIGAPEPPDLGVGDHVQHRWLGVGVVERIWWRDDHWHVATDRFGAPASRLKKVGP
jgi:hypothetical protein